MSILSNILGKIFSSAHADSSTPAAAPASAISAAPMGSNAVPGAAMPSAPPATVAATSPMNEVDVEEVLNGMAQHSSEKLNWKTSIVDLLKLLQLDSSLQARKALAQELHYSGDANDSATMNIWLHRQVMNKLAANGGKVPADLKD